MRDVTLVNAKQEASSEEAVNKQLMELLPIDRTECKKLHGEVMIHIKVRSMVKS